MNTQYKANFDGHGGDRQQPNRFAVSDDALLRDEPPKLKRYAWKGRNRAGQEVSGVLYGDDKMFVRAQLSERGIMALHIEVGREPWLVPVSVGDVSQFLQELATLYRSGVPLLRILDVQLHSQTKAYFRTVIQTLRVDIERGQPLHRAMRHHPKVFDALTCNLIASGEESGQLAEVLDNIVYTHEQRYKIISQIKTAMWYPTFVLLMAALVWVGVLTFVVPVFEQMYRTNGRTLPVLTQSLIEASGFLRHNALGLLIGIGVITVVLRKYWNAVFRDRFEQVRLRTPLLGRLLRWGWHAQFARTLALLYQSGIPLHRALEISADTVSGTSMQRAIRSVTHHILNGHSLSLAMSQFAVFEAALIQRIQIGEESGALAEMLIQHAVHDEFLLEQGIKRMSSLIEPVLIVVIGLVVVTMVVALYLPILQLGGVG